MQNPVDTMHFLTNSAISDMQKAFQECKYPLAEGLILSALVKLVDVHEMLSNQETVLSA